MEENERQELAAAIDAEDTPIAEGGERQDAAETETINTEGGGADDAERGEIASADGAEATGTEDGGAQEDGGGEGQQTTDGGDDKPFEPDDALLERAVKAGLSLADARSFRTKGSMERILTALEATASNAEKKDGGAPADDGSGGGEGGGGGNDNPLSALDAITEDNGYDDGLVAAVRSLRDLVIEQGRSIFMLSQNGNPSGGGDDGEAARKAAAEAEAKKKEALEKRKSLALAKPGGEGAARKTKGDDGGEYGDIIAELEERGIN